jgi:hypothetical protein
VILFGIPKREFKIFLEQSLRIKEKELFLSLHELQGVTFSTAVSRLSSENYPESTTKIILKRLKKFNVIDFGDMNNRGKPLKFTKLGEAFFNILNDKRGGKNV